MRSIFMVLALVFLASGGCGQAPFDKIDLDPSLFSTPAAAAAISPGVAGSGQNSASPAAPPASAARPWLTDYAAGLSAAAQEQKPLLLVLHRQSCDPCKQLLYGTLRAPGVMGVLNERCVLSVLDVERQDARVLRGLTGGRAAVPMLVLIERGKIVARRAGYVTSQQLYAWLNSIESQQRQGVEAKPVALPIVRPLITRASGCGCGSCNSARYTASVSADGDRPPRRAAGAALRPLRRVVRFIPILRRRSE